MRPGTRRGSGVGAVEKVVDCIVGTNPGQMEAYRTGDPGLMYSL